jgi:hypothetical protein
MLAPDELTAVDTFRFSQRMPSRAAAVRELIRLGLSVTGVTEAVAGTRSRDYGVLSSPGGGGNGSPKDAKGVSNPRHGD